MFWLLFNFSRGRFFRSRRPSSGLHGSTGAACTVRPGRRCRCCLRPAQSSKSHVLRASCSCRGRAARSGRRRQCHAGAAQSVRVRRRRLRWCAAWPSLRHRHRADANRPRRRRGGVGAPLDPLLFECSLVGPPPSSKGRGPWPLALADAGLVDAAGPRRRAWVSARHWRRRRPGRASIFRFSPLCLSVVR